MDNFNDLANLECCTIPKHCSIQQILCREFQSLESFRTHFTLGSETNEQEYSSSINIDKLREFIAELTCDKSHAQLTNCLKRFHKKIQRKLTIYRGNPIVMAMLLDVFVIMIDLIVLTKSHLKLFELENVNQDCKLFLLKHWAKFDNSMFRVMVENLRALLLKEMIDNIRLSYQLNVMEYYELLYYSNLYGGERYERCTLDKKYEIDNDNFFFDLDFSINVYDTIAAESKSPKIPIKEFMIPETSILINVNNIDHLPFFNLPFIFSLDHKIYALEIINNKVKAMALKLPFGQLNRAFRLRVRRDHIEADGLNYLMLEIESGFYRARLPIHLEFHNEIGSDEGGLSREFFRMMTKRMFDSRFPLFTAKEGGFYWFKRNHKRIESTYAGFKMFGALLGLALYNNILVKVRFPNVFYRKLLGLRGTLSDLHNFDPHLAASLTDILNYEEDNLEDIFMLNFVARVDNGDGTSSTLELMEGGENIAVTQANKQEYVRRYVDLILNESIDEEFTQFKCGFGSTVSLNVLKLLFRPEELGEFLSGADCVDVNSLQNAVTYGEGFESSSPTMRLFWEVVREMSESELRALLIFVTASEHVPLEGAPAIQIWDGGADSDNLPWSSTCFNRLSLPRYSSKEKLKDKLLKAISYNEGFGLA